MRRKTGNREFDPRAALFDVAAELRALAYLFETQGAKANQISEEDMDVISHGIGRILKRLAARARRVERELDLQAAVTKPGR